MGADAYIMGCRIKKVLVKIEMHLNFHLNIQCINLILNGMYVYDSISSMDTTREGGRSQV